VVAIWPLGGCTGMDIVSLLKKMRVDFSGIEMNITADRAEEHPNVYTKIDLEYVIYGRGIDGEKVKRAIDLSQEKYCSVSAMLRKSYPVNYTWRITAQRPTVSTTDSPGKWPGPHPRCRKPCRPQEGDCIPRIRTLRIRLTPVTRRVEFCRRPLY